MPKAGGRGGNDKKAPPPAIVEEESNVVFGDPKQLRKVRETPREVKGDDDPKQSPKDNDPKKPNTRQLIGGASWTGKLPVNILSEHCQKQKWEKPEYPMSKVADGYSSMVILKHTNPKTKELTALPPFKLPPSHKHLAVAPTAVEARHFAATYALFRVCSMRNIHMMLPPSYKDMWKQEFQELKQEDVKEGRGWMYEADPFTARLEREEVQKNMAKKREIKEKQRAKETVQPAVSLGSHQAGINAAAPNRHLMKGWVNVPKVEMGKRIRTDVERLVRTQKKWNPHGLQMSPSQRKHAVNELVILGFRPSHVEEAVEECRDREEALEWLLIHVPEDDLPKWSLPEGYTAGISMASGNLKRDAAVKRLNCAGYSIEACEISLDASNGNEGKAAQRLQHALAFNDDGRVEHDNNLSSLSLHDSNDDEDSRSEEKETLQAIYGSRLKIQSDDVYEVELHIPKFHTPSILNIRLCERYPKQPPTICILAPMIPAYIRLSIIRQAVEHAFDKLLGGPMIFDMVDWLETNIPRIIESPGRLRDVCRGICVEQRVQEHPSTKARPRRQRMPNPIRWQSNGALDLEIHNRWQSRQFNPKQQKMLAGRQNLPAWDLRHDVVTTINENQVTIISGETGSGKSTQAVQFILDDMIQRKLGASANIICTQPRRISVLGLADRVSEERCSVVGDEIGYIIRGESRQKAGTTRITFMTTGVLLRRLQTSGGSQEDVIAALADVSHVFVDEVHERGLDTDFLLILLRDVLAKRRDLRVVLMSATLDAGVFKHYFQDNSTVGQVEIRGRTYPIEDYYLDDVIRLTGYYGGTKDIDYEDDGAGEIDVTVAGVIQHIGMRINYDLIRSTVAAIDSQLGGQNGGILIFLPGTMEISRALDALRSISNIHALPLHASLTPTEQKRVFTPAPRGKRKVIAATNVAETSITIEDIVAVVDCGRVKETSFDPSNCVVRLEEVWASQAACKQRRGRAGRVRAGTCYKLYTRNAELKMNARPEPEIRRVPLEQLCLSVRAMGIIDVSSFLASALTPPESLAVEGAIELLGRMGVIDGSELTALGKHLSMIPADLRCGKLMVYGATFGCLDAAITIAATLTVRSPFLSPQSKRDESKAARTAFAPGQGDLICDLRAFEEWSLLASRSSYRETRLWCDANFLSPQTLNDIASNRTQYQSSLAEAGFIPTDYQSHDRNHANVSSSSLNVHNANFALLRALIAGAFNPQVARIDYPDKKFAPSHSGAVELDPEARAIKFLSQDAGRVFIHPSSTLFSAEKFPGSSVYMAYFNKMATSKVFIRELTPFNAYAALMFGGPVGLDTLGRGLIVDGWLRMRGWARIGVLVRSLRRMLDLSLERKIENPEIGSESEDNVVDIVRRLVEYDGLDR